MLSAIFPKWQECVGMLITSNSWCPLLEYFQCTPTMASRTIQLQVILMVEVLIVISIINWSKQKIEVYSFCSVVIEYSDLTSALHSSEAWVALLCFKVVLVLFHMKIVSQFTPGYFRIVQFIFIRILCF